MDQSFLGCAVSGLIADSRTMVERARAESQNHWFTYDEQMSVESVAQAVSNLAIQFSGDYDSKEPAMVKYTIQIALYNIIIYC